MQTFAQARIERAFIAANTRRHALDQLRDQWVQAAASRFQGIEIGGLSSDSLLAKWNGRWEENSERFPAGSSELTLSRVASPSTDQLLDEYERATFELIYQAELNAADAGRLHLPIPDSLHSAFGGPYKDLAQLRHHAMERYADWTLAEHNVVAGYFEQLTRVQDVASKREQARIAEGRVAEPRTLDLPHPVTLGPVLDDVIARSIDTLKLAPSTEELRGVQAQRHALLSPYHRSGVLKPTAEAQHRKSTELDAIDARRRRIVHDRHAARIEIEQTPMAELASRLSRTGDTELVALMRNIADRAGESPNFVALRASADASVVSRSTMDQHRPAVPAMPVRPEARIIRRLPGLGLGRRSRPSR